jgi:DNA-binding beta-propeller fold protein YncE
VRFAPAIGLVAIGLGCGAPAPPSVASLPIKPFVVVANQQSGVATFVEVATGAVSHVAIGAKPHEVAVSPDARVAVFTVPSQGLFNAGNILVMDLTKAALVRTIELDGYKEPHGLAFLSDSVALVGTLGGISAVFVDVRNGRVLRAIDGLPANPYIVKLASSGFAYVSSPHSSRVTEIDVTNARTTRTLDIPDDPAGIAVSLDGKELYAAVWRENVGGGITIFDLETGAVTTKLPATQPRRLNVTADGKFVIATDRDDLRIIDRATRAIRSVALGPNAGASGVACSPDSMRCYVALSQAGDVLEVDVVEARVLRRFAAQKGVDGLDYVGQ